VDCPAGCDVGRHGERDASRELSSQRVNEMSINSRGSTSKEKEKSGKDRAKYGHAKCVGTNLEMKTGKS